MRLNEVKLLYEHVRESLLMGWETLRGDTMERGQFFSRKLLMSFCCSSIFPPFARPRSFPLFIFAFPLSQSPTSVSHLVPVAKDMLHSVHHMIRK